MQGSLRTLLVLVICLKLVTVGGTDEKLTDLDLSLWPRVDLWNILLQAIHKYDQQPGNGNNLHNESGASDWLGRMELDLDPQDMQTEEWWDDGPTERDRAIGAALGPYLTPLASPNISKACQQASRAYVYSILRKEWALKMFDATGKFPDGLLEGNTNMFGNWDECLNVTATFNASDIGGEDPVIDNFSGKFCGTYVVRVGREDPLRNRISQMKSLVGLVPILPIVPIPYVAEGICMPSVCTAQELMDAFQAQYLPKGLYLSTDENNCFTKNETNELTSGAIAVISILGLVGACMLLGTIVDVVDSYAKQAPESMWSSVNNVVHSCSTLTLRRVLCAFSVYTNGRKLLDTSSSSDTLGCLHGIRFLSNTWVILGHTYFFLVFSKHRNINVIGSWFQSVPLYAVLNATVSVDSFFLLSGLLVAYGVMRQLEKTHGKFDIVMFYVHRYIRLTPVMMLIIGFLVTIYPHLGSGPAWGGILSFNPDICSDNWWTNLLYINNLVHMDRQCLGQTWYLANDMQMFIFSPLVLLPLWYWPTFGQLWIVFLICFFTGINAMITAVHDIGLPGGDDQDLRYMKPWCRAGAYLVGIYTGWILYKIRGKKIHIPSPVVAIVWICSALTACLIIYGIYGLPQPPPRSENIIYAMLNRTAWTVCLAWVIFACVTGYGGIINDLLSWKAFIPLSRLTYTSYLVHIDIQQYYWFTNKMPVYLDQTFMVYMFLGSLPIIFAVSAVFSLALESPMIGLEKIIFGRNPPKPDNGIQKPKSVANTDIELKFKTQGHENPSFVRDK